MPFTISAATPADAPGLAENNMFAFYHTDQHWRAMWGSKPLSEVIEDAAARLPHILVTDREKKRHIKAVDDATGVIIGYARWILPEDDDRITWPEAQVPEPTPQEAKDYLAASLSKTKDGVLLGINNQLQAYLGNPLEVAEEEILKSLKGPFLVLDYLTVHPDHRRKGVATALVTQGLKQADAVGMAMFVMGTMAAQPMYEKLGFELIRSVEVNTSKFGIDEPHRKSFLLRRRAAGQ